MNCLTNNKKYENIIMSYLEVHRRLNADKVFENEIVMGAMIRNMILEVEEIVRDYIENPSKRFNECIEKIIENKKTF